MDQAMTRQYLGSSDLVLTEPNATDQLMLLSLFGLNVTNVENSPTVLGRTGGDALRARRVTHLGTGSWSDPRYSKWFLFASSRVTSTRRVEGLWPVEGTVVGSHIDKPAYEAR